MKTGYRNQKLPSTLPAQQFGESVGHLDATSHDDHIDVIGRPFQENISHITSNHIALYTELVGHLTNLMEYLLVQNFGKLLV